MCGHLAAGAAELSSTSPVGAAVLPGWPRAGGAGTNWAKATERTGEERDYAKQ